VGKTLCHTVLCLSGCTLRRLLHGVSFSKRLCITHLCLSGCTLRRLLHGVSFSKRLCIAHLLCLSGCTLRRLLHGVSFSKRLRIVHLLCLSGCTLRQLLHGACRTRGWSTLPVVVTSNLSNAEDCRSCLFQHGDTWIFLRGLFTGILYDSASLKTSPPREEKSAGLSSIVCRIT
jgi:hypothetical protein